MYAERKLSEKQRKVQEYLGENHIEEILADLLNTLAHSLDPKPVVFMIKYLSTLCTKEDLAENGITISGPLPSPNLAVIYPTFSNPSKNLFKTFLTPDVFGRIKDRRTSRNTTIRDLIAIGMENEAHRVGIVAPDEDSYSIFCSLFDPILENLNKGIRLNESFICGSSFTEIGKLQDCNLSQKENQMIKNMKIKIRRNLSNHSFNCYLLGSERRKIKQEIQDIVLEQDQRPLALYSWNELNGGVVDYLKQNMGIRNFSTDKPQGLRYKDWPSDRAVILNRTDKYCYLVNKEDHLEFIKQKDENIDFYRECLDAFNRVSEIEKEVSFAKNRKYGYISTNPKYVGLACRIKLVVEVPEEKWTIFRTNLASIDFDFPFLEIQEVNGRNGSWVIKNNKSMGFNEEDLIRALKTTISFLLTDIVEPDPPKEEQSLEINTIEVGIKEEEIGSKGNIEEHSHLDRDLEIRRASIEGEGEFTLEQFGNSEISYPVQVGSSFGILKKAYFVIRRNIEGFPLKYEMRDEENNALIEFIKDFAHSLPSSFAGEIIQPNHGNYREIILDLIAEYDLMYYHDHSPHKLLKDNYEMKWPQGTTLFRSYDKRLFIIVNFEDHLTILYNYDNDMVVNALKELSYISQTLHKKTSGFMFYNETGYRTVDPCNNGSGGELVYVLNLPDISLETVKAKAPEKVAVYEKNGDICLRINRIYPVKIRNLLELVSSLIHDQKKALYYTKYQQLLQNLYPDYILCKLESLFLPLTMTPLDTFSPSFEIQPPDFFYYTLFAEPYMDHLKTYGTETTLQDKAVYSLKDLSQLDPIANTMVDTGTLIVKVEIGRNFEAYPFKTLMTTQAKQEMNDHVQETFNALKVEGDLLDAKVAEMTRPHLNSLFHDPSFISPGDKVYVSLDNKIACWVNTLDHVRLVSEGPVGELKATLAFFETVIDKFIEEGHEILFDDKFGYVSQKLDLCGLNISFRLKAKAARSKVETLLAMFQLSPIWKLEAKYQGIDDVVPELILTTKGPVFELKLLEDIAVIANILTKEEEYQESKDTEQKIVESESFVQPVTVTEVLESKNNEVGQLEYSNQQINEKRMENEEVLVESQNNLVINKDLGETIKGLILEKQTIVKSPQEVSYHEHKEKPNESTDTAIIKTTSRKVNANEETEEKEALGLPEFTYSEMEEEKDSRHFREPTSKQAVDNIKIPEDMRILEIQSEEVSKDLGDVSGSEVMNTSAVSNTSDILDGDKQSRKISAIFKKYMQDGSNSSKLSSRRSDEAIGKLFDKETTLGQQLENDNTRKVMSVGKKTHQTYTFMESQKEVNKEKEALKEKENS